MATKTRTEIADIVRRMLAKAKSNASTQAEIETFVARASKLMLEYELTESDIKATEQGERKPTDGYENRWFVYATNGYDRVWQLALIRSLARAHFCRVVSYTDAGQRGCSIVGEPGTIDLVLYLYDVVRRQVSHAANQDYYRIRDAGEAYEIDWNTGKRKHITQNAWRNSFGSGCAAGIEKRLRTERDEESQQTQALIVVKDEQTSAALAAFFPKLIAAKGARINSTAYANGYKAADSVTFTKGIK